jgi:hypothetical protein
MQPSFAPRQEVTAALLVVAADQEEEDHPAVKGGERYPAFDFG